MVTRKQSIEQFRSRMDELIASNYILADKKITDVLKTVTASKLFYELISYCADGFDYETEKAKAFGENGFRFPQTDKELVAFVFCLLGEFDSGRADILKILEKYFPADNYDKSYKRFCAELLTPFKDCVLNAAEAMVELGGDGSPESVSALRALSNPRKTGPLFAPSASGEKNAVNYGDNTHTYSVSRETIRPESDDDRQFEVVNENFAPSSENGRKNYYTCFADIQRILLSEKTKIMHCRIKDDKKDDVMLLLYAFKDCLFLGNKDQIKIAFIGYKYAVMNFKRLDSEVDEIERILKFCKIL